MRGLAVTIILGGLAAGLGCKPNVGAPASLIAGPTILAVRGEPAEAAANEQVSYELLAVDTDGRIPADDNAVSRPALWAICTTPKPPIETNAVNRACLDGVALPGQFGPTPITFVAPMPSDACTLFGPITPPVEPPIRPRDPDITGGYYLPVRVSLWIPEALRRPGMASEDTLVGFELERISCGLANAPSRFPREYNATYTSNQNPHLAGVALTDDANPAGVQLLPDSATHVGQGQTVTFEASWTADSAESYPAYDVQTKTLPTRREALVVAWYATGGSFEHDSTGRGEDETELSTSNQWTAGSPGLVHLWMVLRDNRGGTDFVGYDVEVDP
jgi:hypothetical protein